MRIPHPRHGVKLPPRKGQGKWSHMALLMKAVGDYYGPRILPTAWHRSALMRACRKIEWESGARFTSRKIDGKGYGVWRIK